MITTIYNILALIISFIIITVGAPIYVSIWYTVLCVGALSITMLIRRVVNDYPLVTSKQKEGIEIVFGEEYNERMLNYIGSYLAHTILILTLTGNFPLVIAITGVLIVRLLIAVPTHNKVKEYRK
ncbi:membrane protein [Pectobacterium phage vB_PcaM_CBB]|uniref:Putative membrane protein n=1 Tax=Pectobacterium phage vB_PcaM_CBB TaxID=2772511 RepID=A0A1L2CV25_9CAUD|nr:membrane protein [Pectobacterium phage vB_PcaM_CBB]AMM43875.1 putative membrane protein [Pectobacterium phage vB_PcaM_CBB]